MKDKIHNGHPIPPEKLKFMYLPNNEGYYGKQPGLHPTYAYLNRLSRCILSPKMGDSSSIGGYSRSLLARMAPDAQEFSVFDFIWCEIKSVSESPLKGYGFATYIMYLIEQVT